MGKRLIINGAHFSANSIFRDNRDIYVSADYIMYSDVTKGNVLHAYGPYAYVEDIQKKIRNKKINYIGFLASKAGVLSILKTNRITNPCELITTVNIDSIDVGKYVIKQIPEFTLLSNEWLAFSDKKDVGLFMFATAFKESPVQGTFYSGVGGSIPPTAGTTQGLGIEIGYIEEE